MEIDGNQIKEEKEMRRVLIVMSVLILFVFGSMVHAEVTIKLEHDMSMESEAQKAAELLSEQVAVKTNGEIAIQVYPSLQLSGGNIPSMIRQVQIGSVDAALIPSSVYISFQPEHGLWSLPFLFKDLAAVVKLIDSSVGEKLMKITEEKGMKTIAIWPRGFRQLLNSRRDIVRPSDVAGLTFRVPENPMYSEVFRVLNAKPVTIAWGEVHSALALKAVDGLETPTMHIVNQKFYETQKHVTFWNYSTDVLLVSVNKRTWDRLTSRQQRILVDAAREAGRYKYEKELSAVKECIEIITNQGVKVIELTSRQHKEFVDAIKDKVWTIFEDDIGRSLIEEAESILLN